MSDDRINAAIGDESLNLNDPEQLERLIRWRPAKGRRGRTLVDRVITPDNPEDKPATARACIVRVPPAAGDH